MHPAGQGQEDPRPLTLLVGLLGGVGAGKSTVARMLAENGATVLDADRLAAEALAEPEVVAALRERFGPAIFDAAGRIDRASLAARVFGPEAAADRRFLEGQIHPRVRARLQDRIEAARRKHGDGRQILVLDVPLLLEADLAKLCDVLVFVETSPEGRQERCARDRGWSREEHGRREATQLSVSEKRRRAHHVLVNDGTLDELRARVRTLARTLGASSDPSRRRTEEGPDPDGCLPPGD